MAQLSLIEEVVKNKKNSNMKEKRIKDLLAGDQVANFLAVVKEVKKGKTSQNKDYIDLVLGDSSGEVIGKIWEDNIGNCDSFEVGQIIKLGGKVNLFKDKLQIIITYLQKDDFANNAEFLPTSEQNIDALLTNILRHIAEIKNIHLKKLAQIFFKDKNFLERFKNAPAAEKLHHAYVGGFVEHVSEMLDLAELLCQKYPRINNDLLKIGVIFHDIGKLEELALSSAIYRTTVGALVGHLLLGAITIDKAIDSIKDFPEILRTKVLHLIASHHGKIEYGSPILPQTREAVALCHLDDLSTKVNVADKVINDNQNPDADFSDRVFALDTKLYLK